MSAYPAGYVFSKNSARHIIENKAVDMAEDGSFRSSLLSLTLSYRLYIKHDLLTQAETDTLRDFYEANLDDVQVTWADGSDYSGVLLRWSQRKVDYRWNVTLELLGVKI